MLEPIIDPRYRTAYATAHRERALAILASLRWVFRRPRAI